MSQSVFLLAYRFTRNLASDAQTNDLQGFSGKFYLASAANGRDSPTGAAERAPIPHSPESQAARPAQNGLSPERQVPVKSSHRTHIGTMGQSRGISKLGENAIGMTYLLLTWV